VGLLGIPSLMTRDCSGSMMTREGERCFFFFFIFPCFFTKAGGLALGCPHSESKTRDPSPNAIAPGRKSALSFFFFSFSSLFFPSLHSTLLVHRRCWNKMVPLSNKRIDELRQTLLSPSLLSFLSSPLASPLRFWPARCAEGRRIVS